MLSRSDFNAFYRQEFHTSHEVWNKYGTRKGAWILAVPYLPYLPYLFYIHTCGCACVRVRAHIRNLIFKYGRYGSMEEYRRYWVSAFHTSSIPQLRYGRS